MVIKELTNKEKLKIEIGKRVEEIRENNMHMSKCEFAQLIGMKNQYLGYVEYGEKGLTIEKVIEICNKTGVSADYLLRGIDNPLRDCLQKLLEKYSEAEICKSFEILNSLLPLLK